MAKIYYDNDADLKYLKGKKIAIVGYGIQGRAHALNLKDSGCEVIIAEKEGTPNFDIAKKDGFKPMSAKDAAGVSDVIMLLTQDTIQPIVYENEIKPVIKAGSALGFAHGFNIRFNQISPSKEIDVFMVAPKGPGSLVRKTYEEGKGTPCLVAVHQDASGNALNVALAYAKGIGGARAGVIETTFKEETETDLFGEQAVLCGGVSELIKAGFDTLVNAGYQPEICYFECLHELKLITDMIYATGIQGMRRRVSDTAKYGDLTRGKRVIDDSIRKEMAKILEEVQNSKFADEWIAENKAGRPVFNELMKRDENHPIEVIGKKLRGMMSWIKG